MNKFINFGTCTWNYESWVGLIYTNPCRTAAEYLVEYSKHYTTAEIDSWFYKIPSRREVLNYKNAVDSSFRFTCKVPQMICRTHLNKPGDKGPLIANPDFLSLELFDKFISEIDPLIDQIDALMFEFEYLNKQKMSGLNEFIDKLGAFFTKLPKKLPYALEPRNSNYLKIPYFDFVKGMNLIHVLSEKNYMPHAYDIYNQFGNYFGDTLVVRLLGGDRKEIEEKTNCKWDAIIDPKEDLDAIVTFLELVESHSKKVYVNVNNHYEGSAPLTVIRIMERLKKRLALESQM